MGNLRRAVVCLLVLGAYWWGEEEGKVPWAVAVMEE